MSIIICSVALSSIVLAEAIPSVTRLSHGPLTACGSMPRSATQLKRSSSVFSIDVSQIACSKLLIFTCLG